jgi:hypothetical protein
MPAFDCSLILSAPSVTWPDDILKSGYLAVNLGYCITSCIMTFGGWGWWCSHIVRIVRNIMLHYNLLVPFCKNILLYLCIAWVSHINALCANLQFKFHSNHPWRLLQTTCRMYEDLLSLKSNHYCSELNTEYNFTWYSEYSEWNNNIII